MDHYSKRALELFQEGYNCSQSVFGAFAEDLGIDFATAMKLSSSFGGGMGRMREVCGAVTGMFMVAGLKYGYDMHGEYGEKSLHAQLIQLLAKQFKETNKSIICKDLLALSEGSDNVASEKKTTKYSEMRPCSEFVGHAAELLEELMENKQVKLNNMSD